MYSTNKDKLLKDLMNRASTYKLKSQNFLDPCKKRHRDNYKNVFKVSNLLSSSNLIS